MKMVKASEFNNYINDGFAQCKYIDIGTTQVAVKKCLTIDDVLDFVDVVVDGCFQNDEYMPELKDFLIRIQVIYRYTNIELPEGTHEKYDFLYGSDIFNTILGVINDSGSNELSEIVRAINCKIENMESMRHNEYKKKIDEVYELTNSVTAQIKTLIDGMDANTISDMATAFASISNGDISQEAFTRAFINMKKDGDE